VKKILYYEKGDLGIVRGGGGGALKGADIHIIENPFDYDRLRGVKRTSLRSGGRARGISILAWVGPESSSALRFQKMVTNERAAIIWTSRMGRLTAEIERAYVPWEIGPYRKLLHENLKRLVPVRKLCGEKRTRRDGSRKGRV